MCVHTHIFILYICVCLCTYVHTYKHTHTYKVYTEYVKKKVDKTLLCLHLFLLRDNSFFGF